MKNKKSKKEIINGSPCFGMSFDHLSASDFEELTYNLLEKIGFVNLDWRKGSGKVGSSADQGRDIVADYHRKDADGAEVFERYFVQCKHYKEGVPPEKLSGAIAWAEAERPAILLIVVSNFLSNSAKNWLKTYESNNRPPFRIKIWERKNIEQLLSSCFSLTKKYKLNLDDPAAGIHPAHLKYILHPSINTVDHLISILDEIEPSIRDEIFSWTYHFIINPRHRKAINGDEKVGDLLLDEVDYKNFKNKCYELRELIQEFFIVQIVMFNVLEWVSEFNDIKKIDEVTENHKSLIEYLLKNKDQLSEEKVQQSLKILREIMQSIPSKQKKWEQHYKFICEEILPRLYVEESILRSQIFLEK